LDFDASSTSITSVTVNLMQAIYTHTFHHTKLSCAGKVHL
jgi:hypothetical protein